MKEYLQKNFEFTKYKEETNKKVIEFSHNMHIRFLGQIYNHFIKKDDSMKSLFTEEQV